MCLCEPVSVVAQYLHETAAFSFSADEKACGDTGDLKKWEREEKQRESGGQREVNESFIK